MSHHRAPRQSEHRAARQQRTVRLPSWRLLVPGVGLALGLAITLLVLVPGSGLRDGSPADRADASAALGKHQSAPVSRNRARSRLRARRARPMANVQARAAAAYVERERVRRARVKARKKREAKERRRLERLAKMRKTSSFRVGSFNILGSQHTRGPGGYGPGPERAGISSGLITGRGVDVVGLQEVQDDQLPVFLNRLPGYQIWPQHALGRNGQRLQIAWRTSQFEMVDNGSVSYVFDSQTIPLPYVLLRDRETRAEFWVITTHNSARDLEGERDSATARQIALIKELQARNGKPVLILGDVNEHEEFFYKVCQATGFLAANGGGPGCSLPPRPLRVDWIMGGGGAGVTFSGYVQDGASLARASDHYFIHAQVSVIDPGEKP